MLFPSSPLQLATDVWLLQAYANSALLLAAIQAIEAQAAFRHYAVPGGKSMSVAMTSCGARGWTSSEEGYCYLSHDPLSLAAWPVMPAEFQTLAHNAAGTAGWPNFKPDTCLINRYSSGASMGLHQDRDEQDLSAPIVSVSIGASCKFMLGGLRRSDAVKLIDLHDGDVLVWGGGARLVFHGVRPLLQDQLRYNLTFRKAM
jgi:DNA oxidative demethylase